jgi:two-component system sensor histidine kinase CreC
VKIRTRLFLAFLLVAGVGFYFLVDWILEDLRPRYLATMEEAMVDTATILSSHLATSIRDGDLMTGPLGAAFDDAAKRSFSAQIYEVNKDHLNMSVYVTDATGKVLYDSTGHHEGKDYSKWNDVVLTLRGEYGARATQMDPSDPNSTVLYVAAPVRVDDRIVGVLTVSKPTDSITQFLATAKRKIITATVLTGLAVVILGMVVSAWITLPIQKLTRYANAIRDGRRVSAPRVGHSELGILSSAFEQMRDALEGKQYVERYVQTLTHEMKSPLSAIRGAAELLDEEMPAEKRAAFLANIRVESNRIQMLIDRLLELAAIESRKGLHDVEIIDPVELVNEVVASMSPVLESKGLTIDKQLSCQRTLSGERFLLRQALVNLLQNAADFSPAKGKITVELADEPERIRLSVSDQGPGFPDYALERAFERFYSLKRPDTGHKGSGLGLTFVSEIAELHGGSAQIETLAEGGARATLRLPA